MGHLTTGIKDHYAVDVVGADDGGGDMYVYLDKEASIANGAPKTGADAARFSGGFFPHRGRNCHHLIMFSVSASDTVKIELSLDAVHFMEIASVAAGSQLFFDTAALGAGGGGVLGIGGGGANTCPPALIRLKIVDGGGDAELTQLQVRTYGSSVR